MRTVTIKDGQVSSNDSKTFVTCPYGTLVVGEAQAQPACNTACAAFVFTDGKAADMRSDKPTICFCQAGSFEIGELKK